MTLSALPPDTTFPGTRSPADDDLALACDDPHWSTQNRNHGADDRDRESALRDEHADARDVYAEAVICSTPD